MNEGTLTIFYQKQNEADEKAFISSDKYSGPVPLTTYKHKEDSLSFFLSNREPVKKR